MKLFRIIALVLLILWMILIFSLSAQTSVESSDTSSGAIGVVLKILYPGFEKLSDVQKQDMINSLQFIARKGAHFTIYGILGIFSFFAVITYKGIPIKYRYLFSSLICLLYAVSDELHQHFVPGRSCELRDVLVDFSGSITAIILLILIFRHNKLKKFV